MKNSIKLVKLNKDTCNALKGQFVTGRLRHAEDEIFVYDKNTRQLIGMVSKKSVGNPFLNYRDNTVTVCIYTNKKGKLTAEVFAPEAPDAQQYAAMQALCKKNNWLMPVYDKRAYDAVFAYVKRNEAHETVQA